MIDFEKIIKDAFAEMPQKDQTRFIITLLQSSIKETVATKPRQEKMEVKKVEVTKVENPEKRGRKSPNLHLNVLGKNYRSLSEAARQLGISYNIVLYRYKKGLPVEQTFKEAYAKHEKKIKVLRRTSSQNV